MSDISIYIFPYLQDENINENFIARWEYKWECNGKMRILMRM